MRPLKYREVGLEPGKARSSGSMAGTANTHTKRKTHAQERHALGILSVTASVMKREAHGSMASRRLVTFS